MSDERVTGYCGRCAHGRDKHDEHGCSSWSAIDGGCDCSEFEEFIDG